MGLRKKWTAIDQLRCDVLVLQEGAVSDLPPATSAIYQGPVTKCLAALSFNGWSLKRAADDPGMGCLIVCEVADPAGHHIADLAAMWAITGTAKTYTQQIASALVMLGSRPRKVPLLLAGDLNASAQGPHPVDHASNIENARRLGLISTYHSFRQLPHGSEEAMTLRWIGRGGVEQRYHCDFILADRSLNEKLMYVEVGDWDEWIVSGRSDHAPVVADFTL